MASKRKLVDTSDVQDLADDTNLFVDEPPDDSDVDDNDTTDSSDSDSSEYSGIGEEEESDSDSDDLMDSEDDEDDDDDSSDGDDDDKDVINTVDDSSDDQDLLQSVTNNGENIEIKTEVKDDEINQHLDNVSSKTNQNKTKSKRKNETTISSDKDKTNDSLKDGKIKNEPLDNVDKVYDEYEEDSSDEEDIRNTVGNIPMQWYKNYKHIGYDVEGKKLIKPQKGDQLDDFLDKADDPNYWRTVLNQLTGQKIVLSKDDVSLIKNLQKKVHPTQSNEEIFQPWVNWFSSEKMIHPLSNQPAHKRSFIPSKWEKLKVGQMVHSLKMGWMKPSKTEEEQEKEEEEEDDMSYYMIWKDDEETEFSKRYRQHIPAPKLSLPGHEESYNPPPEYLFTKEEKEKWESQEPSERRMNFIPQKFSSLRMVPAYSRFINERFERCLDLYLCPRQRKTRMNVDPEDLIPKLPKPKDLQPFPTTQSIVIPFLFKFDDNVVFPSYTEELLACLGRVYKGHSDLIRSISVDPSGQWLVSGSDDHTIKIWEVSTGRCMKTLNVEGRIQCIAWNPNPAVCLIACVIEKTVIMLNPGLGDKLQLTNTDNMLKSHQNTEQASDSKVPVSWSEFEDTDYEDGYRLKLTHGFDVTQVTWHGKGDYFATVMPNAQSRSVLIHQLSRRRSQNPFSKAKGLVQCVRFHPVRPFLFVATQKYVRVYNLLKQEMSKKLITNCKWVSSMAVHPEGDNVIIGSYDTRMSWFDLDLSTKPYQTLKHHKKAIRQVSYHRRYPLFASVSDDCTIIVCHGMVYNDLLQNPLIVPVKVLRGHTPVKDVGILDCIFHPSQPWIFSAGADSTIRLYT